MRIVALAVVLVALAATARADREAELRETIAHARDTRARARALDELGRLQEASGDTLGAQTSYVESLRAAGDAKVRARLARIDRELADSLDPYAPDKLLGPFATLGDFVASDDSHTGCSTAVDYQRVRAVPERELVAPYRGAELFTIGCDHTRLFAGVELADGWYVTELAGDPATCNSESTGRSLAVVPARGGEHEVRASFAFATHCRAHHSDTESGTDEVAHVVIGVGASGVPSATAPIVETHTDWSSTWDDEGAKHHEETQRAAAIRWHADGSFTVVRRSGTFDQDLLGHHAPRFP